MRPSRAIIKDMLEYQDAKPGAVGKSINAMLEDKLPNSFNKKRLHLYSDLVKRGETSSIADMVRQNPQNEFPYLISIAAQKLKKEDKSFNELLFPLIHENQMEFFASIIRALKSSDSSLKVGACKCLRILKYAEVNKKDVIDQDLFAGVELTDISSELSKMLGSKSFRFKIEALLTLSSLANNLRFDAGLNELSVEQIVSLLYDKRPPLVEAAADLLGVLPYDNDLDTSPALPKVIELLMSKASREVKISCSNAVCAMTQMLGIDIKEAFPGLKIVLEFKTGAGLAILAFSSALKNEEDVTDYIPNIIQVLDSDSSADVEPAVIFIEDCIEKKVPVPVEEIKKKIPRLLSQEELKMYANWLLKILDEIPPPN